MERGGGGAHQLHPGVPSETGVNILEDDQQLYDWGIENRLDQYYQQGNSGSGHPQQYPSDPQGYVHYQQHHHQQSSPYPPPVHQSLTPPPTPLSRQQLQQQQQQQPRDALGYLPEQHPAGSSEAVHQRQQQLSSPPPVKTEPGYDHQQHQSFHHRTSGRRPTMPQVDMDANEIMKVERKRARNRVAASKCRLRKLERISVLDHQASQLRAENEELAILAEKLKAQVYSLKQELRWHVNNGCKVFQGGSKPQTDSPDSTSNLGVVGHVESVNDPTSLPSKQFVVTEL